MASPGRPRKDGTPAQRRVVNSNPEVPGAAPLGEKPVRTRTYGPERLPSSAWEPGTSGNPKGRPPGVVSYRDLLTAEDRARIADAAGCTPLQYLISVMLDREQAQFTRLDAAKAAAPYMHRKMPIAVELPNNAQGLDVAKLLALPREDREQLLGLLQRAGVSLPAVPQVLPPGSSGDSKVEGPGTTGRAKVASPDANGMPLIDPSQVSKSAALQAKAEAEGRPVPKGHLRATNAIAAVPGGSVSRSGVQVAKAKAAKAKKD